MTYKSVVVNYKFVFYDLLLHLVSIGFVFFRGSVYGFLIFCKQRP